MKQINIWTPEVTRFIGFFTNARDQDDCIYQT